MVGQFAREKYAIHQFKDFAANEDSCIIEWGGKTDLAPTYSTVYLQIYNINTSTWETVDFDNTTAVDTFFILTNSISGLSNYKNSSKVVSCRVYQLAQ